MQNIQPLFRAISDPTRRDILTHLGRHELSVADVASKFQMTRAAVKKHLNILESSGLITVTPRGRQTFNRANPGALHPVANWVQQLDRFWDHHLDILKSEIEKDT